MSAYFLDLLLRHRLEIFDVFSLEYGPGFSLEEAVVPTCRLITILEGNLIYRVEGTRQYECGKDSQIFIPAWLKRSWQVSGNSGVKIQWISFSLPFFDDVLARERVGTVADPHEEQMMFRRVLRAWPGHPVVEPVIESELKASLVRFFLRNPEPLAEAFAETPERVSSGVFEVRRIVRWLEEHYRDPAALTRVADEITINKDYFRRLFHRETGSTLGEHIGRLRMLAARYLLRETALRIQEISARVGCADQRYFARQYRKFWNCSPSHERAPAR